MLTGRLEEKKKACIVVRTYPAPSRTSVEASCTAAITDKGEWLRLFPVPWRFLPHDQRFRKYQWVEITVTKPRGDPRPESHRLKAGSIRILSEPLSTHSAWRERKKIIFPVLSHCLCCLRKERDETGRPTLGIFKPKSIRRLIITPDSAEWKPGQLDALRQGHLFEEGPPQQLEKVPFKFHYEFQCDHEECPVHKLICVDWEMAESWRKWRDDYGDEWEDKFRQRYETDMISKYDTYFYVGTTHQHQHVWIIVGLFYPPKARPGLFNGAIGL